MTQEEMKAISRRLLALWTSGNSETLETLVTAGYRNHQEGDVSGTTSARTVEGYKSLVAGYLAAFSDSTIDIFEQIGEGDCVATRWRLNATHTGTYEVSPHSLAPTNRTISWTGIQMDHFEGGKIRESWVAWDKYGMFQALGLV